MQNKELEQLGWTGKHKPDRKPDEELKRNAEAMLKLDKKNCGHAFWSKSGQQRSGKIEHEREADAEIFEEYPIKEDGYWPDKDIEGSAFRAHKPVPKVTRKPPRRPLPQERLKALKQLSDRVLDASHPVFKTFTLQQAGHLFGALRLLREKMIDPRDPIFNMFSQRELGYATRRSSPAMHLEILYCVNSRTLAQKRSLDSQVQDEEKRLMMVAFLGWRLQVLLTRRWRQNHASPKEKVAIQTEVESVEAQIDAPENGIARKSVVPNRTKCILALRKLKADIKEQQSMEPRLWKDPISEKMLAPRVKGKGYRRLNPYNGATVNREEKKRYSAALFQVSGLETRQCVQKQMTGRFNRSIWNKMKTDEVLESMSEHGSEDHIEDDNKIKKSRKRWKTLLTWTQYNERQRQFTSEAHLAGAPWRQQKDPQMQRSKEGRDRKLGKTTDDDCRFHVKGQCRFGDKCFKRHDVKVTTENRNYQKVDPESSYAKEKAARPWLKKSRKAESWNQ